MNPFEFVIAIVFLTGVFSLIRHRMGVRHRWEQPAEDFAGNSSPARGGQAASGALEGARANYRRQREQPRKGNRIAPGALSR